MAEGNEFSLGKQGLLTLGCLGFCAALDAADFIMLPGMFTAFEEDFNTSLSDIGIMYLMQCLLGSLAMPVWGALGDRYSRKHLLSFGCFMWGAFTMGCAGASSFMMFTLFRAFAAIFMSLVTPVAQSVVADLAPSEKRGSLFGQIGFMAMIGAFIGQFFSTSLASEYPLGIRGWRLCLAVVGILSMTFPIVMQLFMWEPRRQAATILAREQSKDKFLGVDWPSLRLASFWLLVFQGVFGSIPWRAFGMFSILWLELIGYTPMQVAIIGGLGMLASAVGHLISGYIGDFAHATVPYRGRVYVAQFSVAIGMFLVFALLMLLPKDPSHMLLFCSVIILFNLTATWAGNATNRPLIADVVPEWSRASIYSYFSMMENVPSAFGGYVVSFMAEVMFGFKSGGPHNRPDIDGMDDAERARNVNALTYSLTIMTLIPWTITLLAYGLMHGTYENDVNLTKARAKKAEMSNARLIHDEESDDDMDNDKVHLLAEGRRG
mmetsp:Transcript_19052/g.26603  ORF Transcript_19052/g.26603 Transcript_19052/m.26603 type:complete len:491 (-) Transcript_19052:378-1850(-)|eukprot:CAMPEP_0184484906 /NCGR_PEP_ID=MMETSP0113_2-20130426/6568_1 /TAXON_ID=91329 /ORGANISM="Norrisiella sphaerica, Strain BC52" /LENGTH=490 /DNA_ID=CAMNT_0026866113 /DNA_START=54 /DNA_END=1526 /DNA_ORIENTATION=+